MCPLFQQGVLALALEGQEVEPIQVRIWPVFYTHTISKILITPVDINVYILIKSISFDTVAIFFINELTKTAIDTIAATMLFFMTVFSAIVL